jgi:hypothetical protein
MREFVLELEVDYYRPAKDERFEGYKLIWYKVILRAVYDYVLYKDSKSPSLRRLAEGSYRWLYESDEKFRKKIVKGREIFLDETPFNSFSNICELLSLDTDGIRKMASLLTRKDIRKIEFFQRSKYKSRKVESVGEMS